MVRLAFTLIGNDAEAEEVVQESFVDISIRLDEPDNTVREPGAYLRTIVVGRCRSLIRRRRVMQQHPPEPPADLPGSAELLWDVLHQLPEDQRITVVLKYYGGYRASEIAKIHRAARGHRPIALATSVGHDAKGAHVMSRFDEDFDRDFPVIAERATPSPDAWASIQQRIADREPTTESEIIMLTENTNRPRRLPDARRGSRRPRPGRRRHRPDRPQRRRYRTRRRPDTDDHDARHRRTDDHDTRHRRTDRRDTNGSSPHRTSVIRKPAPWRALHLRRSRCPGDVGHTW